MNTTKENISGTVERITYQNTTNGFCILRVNVKGIKDTVTVVGNTLAIFVGEHVDCIGNWVNDKNYGIQFKAEFLKSIPPSSIHGIEKYLGSGLIKGIGPHFAKILIREFGEGVFDVIENNPDRLFKVPGIGKARAESITKNFAEQKIVRSIMVFLSDHGVSTSRATRIYKTYGQSAIEVVSSNPYKLARDIPGIGFMSADKIAFNLGIEKHSLIRARAGISHVLFEASSDGHCGLTTEVLLKSAKKVLEIEESILIEAIEEEIKSGAIVKDKIGNDDAIFLTKYYLCEKEIAKSLFDLHKLELAIIDQNELQLDTSLSQEQRAALELILKTKVIVLTGGPGTGKTTLIKSVLSVLKTKKLKVVLTAPTGRAAKRLSESTGIAALTIHRLLEINPSNGKFSHNEFNKLDCDYVVMDEVSMVDINIFHSFLKALPLHTGLLLVGDVDQLPSVGPGNVLRDIIDSESIETIKLTKVFRQSEESKIITNSHLINNGRFPNITNETNTDFYFIEAEQDTNGKVVSLVKDRIPKKFGFDINSMQILCPNMRGASGVRSLNQILQAELNPNHTTGISKFGNTFAINDKVMQMENNYDLDVYNGDIGFIQSIDNEAQELIISFDDRMVTYDYTDLDQLTLAYAITIHKSQGSEYECVVIILTMQSFMMLKRNLIYTAVTRGKKLVIIVGEKKALYLAIKNNSSVDRYSKLKSWIKQQFYTTSDLENRAVFED